MSIIKIIAPTLLALILGFLYGRRVKFTGDLAVAIVAGVIFSVLLQPYPYYTATYASLPFSLSEVFLAALIGILIGSITRGKHEEHTPAN